MSNRGSTGKYPKYVKHRSIRPDRRVCCLCGNKVRGYGYFMIFSPSPGKYLCNPCDLKRSSREPQPQTEPANESKNPQKPLYTPLIVEPWVPPTGKEK